MNLTDLKYIIEIDKQGSISLAAKKLFVAQSNLSRAVKELEKEFDIILFQRTSKGVVTTREGQEFIAKAREILFHVDSLTSSYSKFSNKGVNLRFSVPRASYISDVFAEYIATLKEEDAVRIHYQETNSMQTIRNVTEFHYDVGIIRYNALYESHYLSLLKLKNLQHRLILEFDYLLVTSKKSSIAEQHIRSYEQLEGCIEVTFGDKKLPNGEYIGMMENEGEEQRIRKIIYTYEKGSQFEILANVPNTYMWASPIPQPILDRYGLVQLRCGSFARYMKDVMIFKEEHVPKQAEKEFLDLLREKTREYGVYF